MLSYLYDITVNYKKPCNICNPYSDDRTFSEPLGNDDDLEY